MLELDRVFESLKVEKRLLMDKFNNGFGDLEGIEDCSGIFVEVVILFDQFELAVKELQLEFHQDPQQLHPVHNLLF